MDAISWQLAVVAVVMGVAAGLAFWALGWLAMRATNLWRPTLPFAADILAGAGERERVRYRKVGGEFALLVGALLTAIVVIPLALLLLLVRAAAPGIPEWLLIVALVLMALVLVIVVWWVYRLLQQRRRARFNWAASVAVGNVLKRLNFSGNRVFHDVAVEGAVIDHVVVGTKGVFAINVVARPTGDNGRHVAELRNGKLSLDGNQEALVVGDAARNMTLLSGALSKLVGHRVPVRSVLAVPGWESTPNGEGNHLLLNENNLAMLTSWNTPDAYLMDEDVVTVQKFLQQASRSTRIS